MKATTPKVVSSNDESMPSKAPKRSPSRAPIPVTLEVSPTLFANSAESSRSVSIISGRAGFLFGSSSVPTSEVKGRFTSSALPSCDGKANSCSPFAKYFDIGTSVPIIFVSPSFAR